MNDSKIVVVVHLPNVGEVTKYTVGKIDDILVVTIQKHTFMSNSQALLFAATESGHITDTTNGPYTAQGGICLKMCDKALEEFKKKQKQDT